MDWNLLSTASPAITAWMNPCNRFAIKIAAMLRAMHVRHTAIAACLMADALENDKIQRRLKTKKVISFYSNVKSYKLLTIITEPLPRKLYFTLKNIARRSQLPVMHYHAIARSRRRHR